MAMTVRILITGFGPFPGVRVNPTERLMARVTTRLRRAPGLEAHGGRLTVTYAAARRELAALDGLHEPDAMLLLGLAARARWVRVERFARLNDSPLHPDAAGRGGGPSPASAALPLASTAALGPALAALRQARLRARLSPSAGRYLCNAVYAAGLMRAAGRPVLFVHVPWPRGHNGPVPRARIRPWRPSAARLEMALVMIARNLGVAARTRMRQPRLA